MAGELAQELSSFGGYLVCEECGRRQGLNEERIGSSLRHGWPTCCGYTMRWVTQREIDAGTAPK